MNDESNHIYFRYNMKYYFNYTNYLSPMCHLPNYCCFSKLIRSCSVFRNFKMHYLIYDFECN